METLFAPEDEILIARTGDDVLRWLRIVSEADARKIAERARQRVLQNHTAAHRAAELEGFIEEARSAKAANTSLRAPIRNTLPRGVELSEPAYS